jgi:hypothetical protein
VELGAGKAVANPFLVSLMKATINEMLDGGSLLEAFLA